MLVSDIVRRNAEFFGEREAVVVPGSRITTWGELEVRTNRLARAFGSLGVAKGDRVAMFAPNCGEYIDFFFACAKAGVIGAATNIRLAAYELVRYLNYLEPAAIIVHAEVAESARAWLGELPASVKVIGAGHGHGFSLDLEELIGAESVEDPGVAVADTDVYQIGATSGTTGVPKGALLTHRNAIAAQMNWLAEVPFAEHGTNLQNIPMFFNPGGPAGLNPVLLKGGRTVLFPSFDPARFLRAVPEYGVTNSILVPTMIQMVLAEPDCEAFDLSSLRGVTCGGSPVPRPLLERAREVFGDVFFPFYGMAETYSCGLALRRENQRTTGTEAEVRRLGSAGKPHLLMSVRVVGDDGDDVPHDNKTPGEIWMQGDSVSPGYFRMPEETELSRAGEWFKSGDLGVVDEEGFITVVDRIKDMIITGGINVFSREVEDVLLEHPAVQSVAVIGIPDERWGEAICAVVVLAADAKATEQDVIDFAAERLTHYKRPRSVEFVAELPLSGTGKVLKKELRARHWPRQ